MTIDHAIDRRTALLAGLAGAGTLTLAACGSSSGGSAQQNTGASRSSTAGASTAGTSTAAPSAESSTAGSSPESTPGSSPASSAAATGTQVAKLADITVGEAISVNLDGKPVVVARPTSTTAACFSAMCTHQGCTVTPAGKQLDCPCHGSSFNATTGAVLGGPAPSGLNKVSVTVTDGIVYAS